MYIIVLTEVEGRMLGVRLGEEIGEVRMAIGSFASYEDAVAWLEQKGCYKHPDEPCHVWCEARNNRERGRESEQNNWGRRLTIVKLSVPGEVWR